MEVGTLEDAINLIQELQDRLKTMEQFVENQKQEMVRTWAQRDKADEESEKLRKAFKVLEMAYVSGADGERIESCCNGKHFKATMMAGDRLYRLSYAFTDVFDASKAKGSGGEDVG